MLGEGTMPYTAQWVRAGTLNSPFWSVRTSSASRNFCAECPAPTVAKSRSHTTRTTAPSSGRSVTASMTFPLKGPLRKICRSGTHPAQGSVAATSKITDQRTRFISEPSSEELQAPDAVVVLDEEYQIRPGDPAVDPQHVIFGAVRVHRDKADIGQDHVDVA